MPARERDSFIFDDNHDAPHAMDYFVWVLKRGNEVILVDTGYDSDEATARGRPIAMDPREALRPLGHHTGSRDRGHRDPPSL